MLVQTEALTRALKLLIAANVQFAVIDAEGVKHGTLEIAVTPPLRSGIRTIRAARS